MINAYPPVPVDITHFQRDYGYRPAKVLKWQWSSTFGKWGAFVIFDEDGYSAYTYPMPKYLADRLLG